MNRIKYFFLIIILVTSAFVKKSDAQNLYHEEHRPQIHFSPKKKWMNDPNGLVYYNGIYHMFFQYYPDGIVWGPMHWGHAISKDLVYWFEEPIALYPDTLGYIFSGSAVVDKKNSSGFSKESKTPLVAIFTYNNPVLEKEKKDAQYQGIAYSLDEGKTWTKCVNNPVLKNPGIRDFRDPKVMWYEASKKWIMTLATKDRVTFYSSPDLKSWIKESDFGKDVGAHGGVWECPDLISFRMEGKKVWVLFVSINPGGINGGSATQYFVGDFNGKNFTPFNTEIKWIDYGTDNYAGVTWFNTGNRKIFLGWMSNWLYANLVPTKVWRNAMTLPRELQLVNMNENYYLTSQPVKELNKIMETGITFNNIEIKGQFDLSQKLKNLSGQYQINLSADVVKNFSIVLSNDLAEEVVIGFNREKNSFYIDRRKSGKVDFEKDFATIFYGPRLSKNNKLNLTMIVDVASVELFADNGLTVMTGIFFPSETFNQIKIYSDDSFLIKELRYTGMKSIWQN